MSLTTGLPDLPSHLFWRLERDWGGDPELIIIQRKNKRFLFWTWTADSRTRWADWVWGDLTPDTIRRVASRLAEKRNIYLGNYGKDSLFGDYPPKKLP